MNDCGSHVPHRSLQLKILPEGLVDQHVVHLGPCLLPVAKISFLWENMNGKKNKRCLTYGVSAWKSLEAESIILLANKYFIGNGEGPLCAPDYWVRLREVFWPAHHRACCQGYLVILAALGYPTNTLEKRLDKKGQAHW